TAEAEDAQIDDRIGVGQFPDDKGDEADRGHDREADDPGRAKPVMLAPGVEHDLKGTDREDEEDEPNGIDARLDPLGLEPAEHAANTEGTDCDDGEVDE